MVRGRSVLAYFAIRKIGTRATHGDRGTIVQSICDVGSGNRLAEDVRSGRAETDHDAINNPK